MYTLKLTYLLLFLIPTLANANNWNRLEIHDYGLKTPTFTIYRNNQLSSLSFQGKNISIPATLASRLYVKVSRIQNYFSNKTNYLPILSSSKLKEKRVNGTCEIISSYREIYLFNNINNTEEKTLIYKKGNCAFKGKEYFPNNTDAAIDLQVLLSLVSTASDYLGFCEPNKK